MGSTRAGAPPWSGPLSAPTAADIAAPASAPGGGRDPRGEGRGVQPVLGRADPVGVDRLHVIGVGLPAPAQEELLGGRLALSDDVVGSWVATVVHRGRLGDDRHHLRRQPGEVVSGLLGPRCRRASAASRRSRAAPSRPAGRKARCRSGSPARTARVPASPGRGSRPRAGPRPFRTGPGRRSPRCRRRDTGERRPPCRARRSRSGTRQRPRALV